MNKFIPVLVLICSILSGCGSNMTLSPDEREYRDNERQAKWELCQRIYNDDLGPWMSDHPHGFKGFGHDPWEVKQDLYINNCDRILCELDLWECN